MSLVHPAFKPLLLAASVSLAACGGGSDSTDDDTGNTQSLSGTAAAGAAIVGTVTVKGAQGNTVSTLIEADGSYDVDVSGLTAPYRLRAEGTVGGRSYRLHSYAEAADVGGTVNVTPFTDLIVANAAQQIASAYFDSDSSQALDPAVVDAQEAALQARLQDVLDVLGVGTAIDLLNSSFSADHSGLDAALDLIRIEVDPNTNVATITDLVSNSIISDSILDPEDNSEAFTVSDSEQAAYTGTVSDIQAIANLLDNLTAAFASGLPNSSAIEGLFASNFLNDDVGRSQFLSQITTDPEMTGIQFASVAISDLDETSGTAKVTFNVVFNGATDPVSETWLLARDADLGWQLQGNQRIVELDELSFHCNDYDINDANTAGACGINVQAIDNDFSNNGGAADIPVASAKVELIDQDTQTPEATIYLGTPASGTAGELQVFDEGQGSYTGDWKSFGSGVGQIDPTLFDAGDTIRYTLYFEDLDISDTAAPAIASGATPAAVYSSTVRFAPSTTPKYPQATQTALDAMSNFAPGSNLDISWTVQAGTRIDEVLVQVNDSEGSDVEIWVGDIAPNATSISVASTEFSSLSPAATSYELLVRIYAMDELTGQEYSVDYRSTITVGNTGGGSGSTFTCSYESGWDDTLFGGNGGPINPNSFADYEAVVSACGTAQTFTAADIAGSVFADSGETFSFNDSTGAGTAADPKTGSYDDGQGFTVNFNWWVEENDTQTHNYVVIYADSSTDSNLPAGTWFRETSAVTDISGAPGVSGSVYTFVRYSEGSDYSDTDRASGSDGEIWTATGTLQ